MRRCLFPIASFHVLAALLIALVQPARAQDLEGLALRPAAGGEWQAAFALDTEVELRVRGLMAEVRVRQRFSNASSEWMEGRYRLPLPGEAAVGQLRMQVGDRLIEGEVQEKQRAAATYAAAARAGQTASLVERERPNLFHTQVANIGPGETVEIEIGYWQSVRWQDGRFRLELPLTFIPPYHGGRDEIDAALDRAPQPTQASADAVDLGRARAPGVRIAVDLEAGLPLALIDSPTHALQVRAEGGRHRIELQQAAVDPDRDFELVWAPVASAQPQQMLFVEDRADARYALLSLVPPTAPAPRVPRELILVLDNSGSMHGASMQQAKAAVDRALAGLDAADRFNLLRFDHRFEAVFAEPVEASPQNIERARHFVQGLQAEGGTEMLAPLIEAFAMPAVDSHLRQVVLITDGAISNEAQLLNHIQHGRGAARLFAVGIGSAPNAHSLRRMAEVGHGAQLTIRRPEDVAERVDALLAKLGQPALRDLKIALPAGAEAFPAALPDLYVGEPISLLLRLPQGGGEAVLSGQSPGLPWQASAKLGDARLASTPGVARLWAQAQVAELEDSLRQGVDEQTVRSRVLALALEHQLATRYTSFVAVDRSPRRPQSADLASMEFANGEVANALEFAHGATGFERGLRIALLLAAVALMLLLWQREGRPGTRRLQQQG
jgi:Ca-activated chloride channel family protein